MINLNLDKNKKYLLACSFGPDSMALFDLLIKDGINFSVAHVNYGLRKEAKSETDNLKKYCAKNNIEIYIKFVDFSINRNIEEKCREIRYDFFAEIMSKNEFDFLLVAHNQDDSIETYFLQKKRKSIVDYFGLKTSSSYGHIKVLRPLLNFKKKDLQNYDDQNNVPYAIDSSNLENKFERNKIRHEIVEKMADFERKSILKTIDDENKKLKENRKVLKSIESEKIDDLLKLKIQDLAYLFTLRIRKYIPDFELSLRRANELRKIMVSSKSNVLLKLKGQVYFIKSYGKAQIKPIFNDTNFYYEIASPSKLDCEYFYLDFSKDSSGRNVKKSDYPIIVRNASKNDAMVINNHNVSLRRQFINWKMPAELRSRWPLICDKNGKIIYVPRYSANFVPDSTTNFFVKI